AGGHEVVRGKIATGPFCNIFPVIGPRLALSVVHGQSAQQAQLVFAVEDRSVEILDEVDQVGI
ncbi:MAG: hypothetical protein WBL74_08125, partial [Novosphingobium sp.]|uniref:hypothetical protein n=1 Tax=Novosphingobium sp. TaxID=1874826 RepID=UPI003C7D681D